MTSNAEVLRAEDLAFTWQGRVPFSIALPQFALRAGETVLLLGESGSGKSTVLSLFCGTIRPDRGRITLAGTDMTGLSAHRRDRLRAEKIGVIFQQFNLLPFGTVADNIMLPLRFAPERRARAGNAQQAAAALCRALGLDERLLSARAGTLSVGQQQRVAVARAMIGRPAMIVADEPTSALDAGSQAAFLDLLFEQVRQDGTALLMVSHDPRLGERFDRVLQLEEIARMERRAA